MIHFINILYRITYPLVWVLGKLAHLFIHRLGVSRPIYPNITEEELEFLIKEGKKAGVLEETKTEMLSSVFDFDATIVREVMTPRTDIIAVELGCPPEEAARVIFESGHSRLPLYEDSIDNIIELLYAKDLLRNFAQFKASGTPIPSLRSIMREPMFVPESKMLVDVFKDLKRTKKHMAIIIDEYGGTSGIITMEDAIEQIVGDIQDEYDREEAQIVQVDDNVFDVSGGVNITDFMEYFNLDESFEAKVEDADVDTLGGWMTQVLGELPQVSQTITYESLTIEVTEITRHRIERLRVIKMLTPDQNSEIEGV